MVFKKKVLSLWINYKSMKKILLFLLIPVMGYSQQLQKLQKQTESSNEQIVITRMEAVEIITDYNYLKSSLIISLEDMERCKEQIENYRKLIVQLSIEMEQLSLENEKVKCEMVELRNKVNQK